MTHMRIYRCQAGAGLLLLALALWRPWGVAAQEKPIALELYELTGTDVKYRGERSHAEHNGVATDITTYRDAAGSEIQHVEAVYRQDTLGLISYRLRDTVVGREEDLVYKDGKVQIRYVGVAGDDAKSDQVEWSNTVAFSPVVVPLILRNWERLHAGGEITFDLLVPSRQGAVAFRVRMERRDTLQGAPVSVLRMEPDSWLIRKLVDPMYFLIEDAPAHRVLEFRGRSTIPTRKGKDQDLRMVFRY